jgi:hypothetical protein
MTVVSPLLPSCREPEKPATSEALKPQDLKYFRDGSDKIGEYDKFEFNARAEAR